MAAPIIAAANIPTLTPVEMPCFPSEDGASVLVGFDVGVVVVWDVGVERKSVV